MGSRGLHPEGGGGRCHQRGISVDLGVNLWPLAAETPAPRQHTPSSCQDDVLPDRVGEEQDRPVPFPHCEGSVTSMSYSELTCPCLFGDKWTTGSCRISLPLGLSRKAGSTFDTAGRWHVGSGIQHRALWCGHQAHPSTCWQTKTACHCIS